MAKKKHTGGIRRVDLPPTSQHWLDYREEKHLPINDNSNCIRISGGDLRKLRAAVRKTGGKLEIDT